MRLPTGHVVKFHLLQTVYLRHDNDQVARMVTSINLRPNGAVIYELSNGGSCSYHYTDEISDTKDIIKKTS